MLARDIMAFIIRNKMHSPVSGRPLAWSGKIKRIPTADRRIVFKIHLTRSGFPDPFS